MTYLTRQKNVILLLIPKLLSHYFTNDYILIDIINMCQSFKTAFLIFLSTIEIWAFFNIRHFFDCCFIWVGFLFSSIEFHILEFTSPAVCHTFVYKWVTSLYSKVIQDFSFADVSCIIAIKPLVGSSSMSDVTGT